MTPTANLAYKNLSEMISRPRVNSHVLPSLRTPSDNSLGSVGQCVMDRNAADPSEVSSTPANPHPVGPGLVAQSLHSLQVSALQASRVVEVTFLELCIYFSMITSHTTHSP